MRRRRGRGIRRRLTGRRSMMMSVSAVVRAGSWWCVTAEAVPRSTTSTVWSCPNLHMVSRGGDLKGDRTNDKDTCLIWDSGFCSNTKLVSAYACYILEFFKLLNICTIYTFVWNCCKIPHDVMLSVMFLLLIYCTLLFLHVQIQICNSFDSEEL